MMHQVGTSSQPTVEKSRTIVIVNGTPDILDLIESAVQPGHYELLFVEPGEQAYSQIKRAQPHMVVLCVRIEDPSGFHLLSMLKLDEGTSQIPVLTYTTEYEGQEVDGKLVEPSEDEWATHRPALRMN